VANELQRLLDPEVQAGLVRRLKQLGFRYVTLDLEGFRSGNLNSLVSLEFKRLFSPTATP
jgi:pyridinium-3,5-biscarboxylic acid mononucleotide sulfurtransferase